MDKEALKVIVDKDLESLIPGFLDRRRGDVDKLRKALESEDLEALRITGHSMKGTGGGYGFDALSAIGAAVETAAKAGELQTIREQVEALVDYLDRLQVEFE